MHRHEDLGVNFQLYPSSLPQKLSLLETQVKKEMLTL